jgi:hypothetical protein
MIDIAPVAHRKPSDLPTNSFNSFEEALFGCGYAALIKGLVRPRSCPVEF